MTKPAPMPRRTLAALKASIDKWEKLATEGYTSKTRLGPSTCPLCRLFISYKSWAEDCVNCPVMARTGERYCDDTPYSRAAQSFDSRRPEEFKAAARREADFLKSLIPEERCK